MKLILSCFSLGPACFCMHASCRFLSSETLADLAWDAHHAVALLPSLEELSRPGVKEAVLSSLALTAWPVGQPSALPLYTAPQGKTVKVCVHNHHSQKGREAVRYGKRQGDGRRESSDIWGYTFSTDHVSFSDLALLSSAAAAPASSPAGPASAFTSLALDKLGGAANYEGLQ